MDSMAYHLDSVQALLKPIDDTKKKNMLLSIHVEHEWDQQQFLPHVSSLPTLAHAELFKPMSSLVLRSPSRPKTSSSNHGRGRPRQDEERMDWSKS